MTPEELPGALQAIADRAAAAAAPAATAMGAAYQRHLVTVTLVEFTHPPFTRTTSPPGSPPALVTGTLRRSVQLVPATGEVRATASVAPHTVYARIQELGGEIHVKHTMVTRSGKVVPGFLRWFEDGSYHYARHVTLPPRPYMLPAREETVADGSLRRAAIGAFETTVWGS